MVREPYGLEVCEFAKETGRKFFMLAYSVQNEPEEESYTGEKR